MSADLRARLFHWVGPDRRRAWTPALIAGCGFCLAFGWIWFPAAFARVAAEFPTVFSGTLFSGGGISVFSAALLCGFFAIGGAAHRLAKRYDRPPALPLHGGALVCMAGGLLARGIAPSATAALFGLAAACVGVYWTARLLALPPLRAGFALTVAALLAWGFSPAIPVFKMALLLPVGIVLAFVLAVLRTNPYAGENGETLPPENAGPASAQQQNTTWRELLLRDDILVVSLLAFAFFAFGIVSIAPLSAATGLPASAIGIALATAYCARTRDTIRRASLLAVAAVLPAALQFVFAPGMTGIAAVAGGVMEGAALVAVAAMGKTGMRMIELNSQDYRRAGFCLAMVFVLVNMGGAAGAAIIRTGDTGGWLLAAICLAFCPPLILLAVKWRNRPRRKDVPAAPASSAAASGQDASPQTSVLSALSALWPELTRRECVVSELLVRNMSNPEICAALFVSENTVRTHIKNIYHKTGVASREELKKLLRESG